MKNQQLKAIKINVLNSQTGEFKEQLINLHTDIEGECLIGRNNQCDLILNGNEISRVHGRIVIQNGAYYFIDLGSTSGSQIDTQVAETNKKYLLKQGAMLRIGGFVLTLTELPEELIEGIIKPSQSNEWSGEDLTVRCVQIIAETEEAKTFRFVAEPSILFNYKPGQFITLKLEIDGKKVMRSYSISSAPSRPRMLEITVKRVPSPIDIPDVPPGLVSNWLHEHLQVGDKLQISGPLGKFTYVDNQSKKLLFISAGSGITPMMSMSRFICDTAEDKDVIFVHSAKTTNDIIYRHELESMAARYPNFKLAITTTGFQIGQSWSGYRGRINQFMLQAIAADFKERTIYVCGPNSFMAGIKTMLSEIDFPMENYYEESFGGAKKTKKKTTPTIPTIPTIPSIPQPTIPPVTEKPPEKVTTTPPAASVSTSESNSPSIVFAQSGKEIAYEDEELAILDVAEEEGIDIPSSCRMGSCGTCQVKLQTGKVNYLQEPAFKCEQGYILSCIAQPVGKVIVEI